MGREEQLRLLADDERNDASENVYLHTSKTGRYYLSRKMVGALILIIVISTASLGIQVFSVLQERSPVSSSPAPVVFKAPKPPNPKEATKTAPSMLAKDVNSLILGTKQASEEYLHCGKDMEQALQNDCVYDLMLPAWVPKPCFNESLHDEFVNAEHTYRWYRDSQGVNEVRQSLIETGRYATIFTSHEFHVHHCLYIWRKQIDSMTAREAWVEDWVVSARHSEHCTHAIVDTEGVGNRSIVATFQSFQKCRRYF